jgi:hypothetical protein
VFEVLKLLGFFAAFGLLIIFTHFVVGMVVYQIRMYLQIMPISDPDYLKKFNQIPEYIKKLLKINQAWTTTLFLIADGSIFYTAVFFSNQAPILFRIFLCIVAIYFILSPFSYSNPQVMNFLNLAVLLLSIAFFYNLHILLQNNPDIQNGNVYLVSCVAYILTWVVNFVLGLIMQAYMNM